MSTLGNKGERERNPNKPKFAALDINSLYRSTRGETFEPATQKSTAPRKHGMQSLGKVPSARRPPANLPSLKAETSTSSPATTPAQVSIEQQTASNTSSSASWADSNTTTNSGGGGGIQNSTSTNVVSSHHPHHHHHQNSSSSSSGQSIQIQTQQSGNNNNNNNNNNNSNVKRKRPTTLPLRPAPDPPVNITSTTPSTTSSTPVSSFSATSSSATTSQQNQQQQLIEQLINHQQRQHDQQMHHNVTLDSTASKINDSLNVQLNVKVSPVSTKRPAPPPPPTQEARYRSQLSVQPEPSYTRMLDQKNFTPYGGASASTGTLGTTTGQRSYTNVKLTLRQPSSSLTPIDIQAGPQTLSYSSSSFNAQQGCESHLKITVAGNGESCIQAVRTEKNAPNINQIDTTINIEGNYLMGDDLKNNQYRIVSNPCIPQLQLTLPQSNDRLTEDELRQLIRRQIKQKESLECELEKEREKLQMIRLDIITLTSPIMSKKELKELCDEISRLRMICGKISDEIDVVTAPSPSPRAIQSTATSPNAPPPIPKGLVSRKGHSPSNSILPQLNTSSLKYPPSQPPSYSEVMRESERTPTSEANNSSNLVDDNCPFWTCSICTFQNHHLMNLCETCEMPRVSGITITSSSFRPLHIENNQLQGSSVPTNENNKSNNSNVIQATVL